MALSQIYLAAATGIGCAFSPLQADAHPLLFKLLAYWRLVLRNFSMTAPVYAALLELLNYEPFEGPVTNLGWMPQRAP